jgi:RimJ/RimL family protein N-acetyltransferase
METKRYDFVEVTLSADDYEKVKEVYRLHKEQANKVFHLASGISTDEDIMECIKNNIENGIVLLACDTILNRYSAVVTLDNINMFNGEITNCGCHLIVGKKYWGKESRNIIFDCYKWLKENMKPIKRLEAFVPSNNFGIIKLLKDTGFKVEGTLRNRVIYKNKDGIPTKYNQLVYSNLNLGE